ncbi:ribose 5-phosphate isomerase B [Candidatus Peregrinibacteria bacterium]|nr:ribose 5-phosphate isomerase B [Candidatus Peregrinibacteria bacterium]
MTNFKKIYIGSDHAGFELKQDIKTYLETMSLDIEDVGIFSPKTTDYPDIAKIVAKKIQRGHGVVGILICGTGIGMSMAANRFKGVRGAGCTSEIMAEFSRKHNDANILCLGSRILNQVLAKQIIKRFLETEFEAEDRHKRRIKKMDR